MPLKRRTYRLEIRKAPSLVGAPVAKFGEVSNYDNGTTSTARAMHNQSWLQETLSRSSIRACVFLEQGLRVQQSPGQR